MAAKLLIVAGPSKGAAYFLQDGENIIGRTTDANIVLHDGKVSKRHCILKVIPGQIEIQDAGSSNGTYVNGVLTKKKQLKSHDRISVGPFVLELIAEHLTNESNTVDPLPASGISMEENLKSQNSLLAKWRRKFDEVVLPIFYDLSERYEWLTILIGLFIGFILLNLIFSTAQILETSKETVIREAIRHARFLAKQVAEQNRQYLQEGKDGFLNTDFASADNNVIDAVIVNLEGRVLAPATKLNDSYDNPHVLHSLQKLRRPDPKYWETYVTRAEDDIVVVTTPIIILSKSKGINVPGGAAAVVFSTKDIALDYGTMSVMYFETFIKALFFGLFFIYILYHITIRPLRVLNDDIDSVLKGNAAAVPKRFKFSILSPLIDTINSVLSRIPTAAEEAKGLSNINDNDQVIVQNMVQGIQALASKAGNGVLVLDADGRVRSLNAVFEELTGIHEADAIGDHIANLTRDEALAGLIKEMIQKAPLTGNASQTEDFEFPGGLHRIHCIAVFSVSDKVEAIIFVTEKAES